MVRPDARCAPNARSSPASVSEPPILAARGLVKRYGGLVATSEVDIDVRPGEVHALLGPNGAGKTTLIGLLTGAIEPDAGSVAFAGRDVTRLPVHRRARLGMGRSFQITSVFADLTVLQNIALALQVHDGHSFRFWRAADDDTRRLDAAHGILQRVGLAAEAGRIAAHLGHGQHRQLELGIALAGRPTLLLLDEPMAGMGHEDGRRLTELLRSMKGSVAMLLVEHDMATVFALADRISVLVHGHCIATGSPAEIRAHPEVIRAYLGEERTA